MRDVLQAYLDSKFCWWGLLALFITAGIIALFTGHPGVASFFVVLLVIHVLLHIVHSLRKVVGDLLRVESITGLLEKYLAFVVLALLLFSALYAIANATKLGGLSYAGAAMTSMAWSIGPLTATSTSPQSPYLP
jgi:hypothetical protein